MITVETKRDYDSRDRLVALYEPQEKTTRYSYTPNGLLKDTLKPDGVVLFREYDSAGNLFHLNSSDNSIIYTFQYSRLGQLVSSMDHITENATLRTIDPQGRVLAEKLANNLSLINDYD